MKHCKIFNNSNGMSSPKMVKFWILKLDPEIAMAGTESN